MKTKMEPKDFILLMLMPMILIGIVVYTDLKPDITGFVTAEGQSSIIGIYSIMPSFRAKTDYNIEQEYGNIRQALLAAINKCRGNRNIEACLRQKSNELNWNCEQNENTAVLYDFLDKLKDCMALSEQNVVCKFSLDQRNLENGRNFEINLIDEAKRTKAELKENNMVIAVDYLNLGDILYTGYNNKDSEIKAADAVEIKIEFNERAPIVKSAFAIDGNTRIALGKTFLAYKSSNIIKFIEEGEENSFRAPPPANTIIELPRTRGIKFCARSNIQVNAYDGSDNQVKSRPVVYKFAVTFPRPEEIQEQNAGNNQNTQGQQTN